MTDQGDSIELQWTEDAGDDVEDGYLVYLTREEYWARYHRLKITTVGPETTDN